MYPFMFSLEVVSALQYPKELFFPVILVVIVLLITVYLKTAKGKGKVGELAVKVAGRIKLDPNVYKPVHDVTLLLEDGTTQIDHIYVSVFGIFVVETKNMKGWIFGSERDPNWTQKLFGKTVRFKNPLHQNFRHVKALETLLDIPSHKIYSVITFTGESVFKTPMPANVTHGVGFASFIKTHQEVVFTQDEVADLLQQIQSLRLPPGSATNARHLASLEERTKTKNASSFGEPKPVVQVSDPETPPTTGSEGDPKCPRCSSPMVERTTKKGPQAGSRFLGCSRYPSCRATLPL